MAPKHSKSASVVGPLVICKEKVLFSLRINLKDINMLELSCVITKSIVTMYAQCNINLNSTTTRSLEHHF